MDDELKESSYHIFLFHFSKLYRVYRWDVDLGISSDCHIWTREGFIPLYGAVGFPVIGGFAFAQRHRIFEVFCNFMYNALYISH